MINSSVSRFSKCIIAFLLMLSVVSCKMEDSSTESSRISINSDWKFKLLDKTDIVDEGFETLNYDDANWEYVSLPHTAHIEPLVVNDQWQGVCWYRKSFDVPEFNENKTVTLELEAAMNHSTVWINGEMVSDHNGGYLPVVIDVTDHLNKKGQNIIAVRLNNTDNAVTGPKPLKTLDFNMYGGLYRNAWLTVKEKVYIAFFIIKCKVMVTRISKSLPFRNQTSYKWKSNRKRNYSIRNSRIYFSK